MKRIAFFIKGLGLGGAERHVVTLAAHMAGIGHDVRIFYLLGHKDHFVQEARDNAVGTHHVRFGFLGTAFHFLKFRPALVHAHLPVPSLYSRLLKRLFGYRLVTTYHNVLDRQNALIGVAERLTHTLDDCQISCSGDVARSYPWDTRVINNSIGTPPADADGKTPLRGALALDPEAPVFLCTANLNKKKNHALLLRAFDLAFRDTTGPQHPPALVLIGQDGTERQRLDGLRDTLAMRDHIHFWGPDGRAAMLVREADVFCLSSDFEGLPYALLEAMAVGKPSIVTDAGGMADLVKNGAAGLVVEKGDVEAYAAALHRLYASPDLRRKLGACAQEIVEKAYSETSMIREIMETYELDSAAEKQPWNFR